MKKMGYDDMLTICLRFVFTFQLSMDFLLHLVLVAS